jgi:aspartyl/glutamyl-tRNA(Asn/Gln) amidotransferase C subunit
MKKITNEEIVKLAHFSQINLASDEIEVLKEQIQSVLNYAKRVADIAATAKVDQEIKKSEGVLRSDEIKACQSESILALAPETQDNYFVVPKIIESK